MLFMDVYEEVVRVRKHGGKAALATIVRRLGSTPRKDHAKMLIHEDGSFVGTVGGGCVEAEVWEEAKRVMDSGSAALLGYELTQEDAENEGLVCGGTVEIFVEPILPDPKVVLMGAGHVGQAIAEAAHRVGFQIAVLDDREAFANSERFPHAQETVVGPYESGLEQIQIGPTAFVLVVTRGHSHDQTALEQAIQTKAQYVGLVGSRRKIQLIVKNLLQKGHAPDAFDQLYAPIGLEIGSETPEEIAVSVVAELIAIRKGVHQRSDKQLFIVKVLDKAKQQALQETDQPSQNLPKEVQVG